jgi:hypothetical protein
MKYRPIKTPPVCGSISLKESVNSALAIHRDEKFGAFKSSNKKVGAGKLRNSNGARTDTKGAGKRYAGKP